MISQDAIHELFNILGQPWWFHHHGLKFRAGISEIRSVKLFSSACDFLIESVTGLFLISWEIRFSLNEKVNGKIYFSREDLRKAFRLEECDESQMDKRDHWLLNYKIPTVPELGYNQPFFAKQGRFIRQGDCLNIPGPGAGHDGDPNVSIELSDQIKKTVRDFLDKCS